MQIKLIESNPLLKKAVDFALRLIEYCDQLEVDKKFVIAKQLLRSGTAIGANSIEAQNAESKRDFLHKLKIAEKEADESHYWLLLCSKSHNYPNCDHLLIMLEEINRILGKIISTTKKNEQLSHKSKVQDLH